MKPKLVGITCSSNAAAPGLNARQFLNTAYVRAIEAAGGVPILIPNLSEAGAANTEALSRYLDAIDGLMLSGGVDVAPSCFGEEPHPELGEVDEDRDRTELALIRLAIERDYPVFGICRGVQVLNVALGGTLYQDLPSQIPACLSHRQSDNNLARGEFSHSIEIEPGTRLSEIVGASSMQTNSFHHQSLKDIAPGLVVTARAPDNIIEAVENPDSRFLVAVQFHPEETAPHDDLSRRLFEQFIRAL